jgi:hypothetical protein
MSDNMKDQPRPLAPPTQIGDMWVRLRPGSLRCETCGHVFKQHEAEVTDGGVRFACHCGADILGIAR